MRVDVNRLIHMDPLQYWISPTGCFHWQPCEWQLQGDRWEYRKGDKTIMGNGSHANWRQAARPVNLSSEPLNPGVRLGNDISSFTSPLYLSGPLCWSWRVTEEYHGGRRRRVCIHAKMLQDTERNWFSFHLFRLRSTNKGLAWIRGGGGLSEISKPKGCVPWDFDGAWKIW